MGLRHNYVCESLRSTDVSPDFNSFLMSSTNVQCFFFLVGNKGQFAFELFQLFHFKHMENNKLKVCSTNNVYIGPGAV
jgi:hypothetical protein